MQKDQKDLIQGGFSWEVQRYTPSIVIDGKEISLTDNVALVRSDNQRIIQVTNATYTETKNARFVEIVNEAAEKTGYQIQGFDEFKGGDKILAYLKNDNDAFMEYLGIQNKNFMVVGNGHDGQNPLFFGSSSFFIKCQNQWGQIVKALKIRHTKNHDSITGKVAQVMTLMSQYKQFQQTHAINCAKLAEIKIDNQILEGIADALLGINDNVLGVVSDVTELSTRMQNNKKDLMLSMYNQTTEDQTVGFGLNLFGAMNGITHFTTHVKSKSKSGEEKESDAYGNLLGGLMKTTDKGFSIIRQIAKMQNVQLVDIY